MIKVCIQAGHVNRTSGMTGAPQERENNKRIADRLCAMLRDRGFEVVQTDANANSDPNITKTDFSLFLALHCDADIPNDGGSGFADYADPATDSATTESQRICKIINDVYFPETKIVYRNMSNINTRQYYMWKYLTPKTPCVLLEMGQSIDPHDSVLLGNTDLIASAITRALCKAFNVAFDITPNVNYKELLLEKDKQIQTLQSRVLTLEKDQKDLSDRIIALESNIQADLGLIEDWQQKVIVANKSLENANKSNIEMIAEKNRYKGLYENALKDQINKYTGWQLIKLGVAKLTKK